MVRERERGRDAGARRRMRRPRPRARRWEYLRRASAAVGRKALFNFFVPSSASRNEGENGRKGEQLWWWGLLFLNDAKIFPKKNKNSNFFLK